MAPRVPLRSPTVIRRHGVEPPTEGPEVEAFIRDPQGLLEASGLVPPRAITTVPTVSLPASVQAETDRAVAAQARGSRYAFRGEVPVRITADLPKGLHKALRHRCTEDGLPSTTIVILALNAYGIVEK